MKVDKKYKLAGNLIEVQSLLTDIQLYGKLHPLITQVQHVEDVTQKYKIWEKPLSWFPITIQYGVKVKSYNNIVEYNITEIPFTTVSIKYELVQTGISETEASFSLQITKGLIGKKMLLNQMVAAQNQLMESFNIALLDQ